MSYFITDELKENIIENGDDAFGLVVTYLIRTYGLSRNKAQEPAREIIKQVLSSKGGKKEEKEETSEKDKRLKKFNTNEIFSHLFNIPKFSFYGEEFLNTFLSVLEKNIEEFEDWQNLAAVMYRKCLFNPTLRSIEDDGTKLRELINSMMNEIESFLKSSLHIGVSVDTREIDSRTLIILKMLNSFVSETEVLLSIINSKKEEPFFPTLSLFMGSFSSQIKDNYDRFRKIKEENESLQILDNFMVPSIFPLSQAKQEKNNEFFNIRLLNSFSNELIRILNENPEESLFSKRKRAFGITVMAYFAHVLYKANKQHSIDTEQLENKTILELSQDKFLNLFSFASDLETGNWIKEIRNIGFKVKKVSEILRYSYNPRSSIQHTFGEKKSKELTSHEILSEMEKRSSNSPELKILLDIVEQASMKDTRMKAFFISIIKNLTKHSVNNIDIDYAFFEDELQFFKEMIAYIELNRKIMAKNFSKIRDSVDQENEKFSFSVSNVKYSINYKILEEFAEKNKDIDFINKFVIAVSLKKQEKTLKEEEISIDKFLSVIDEIENNNLENGILFSYKNKKYFINNCEFLDFLIRTLNEERFQELDVEIKYKKLLQLVETPLIITIDNIVRFLPPLNKYQDFFEIGYFFMVGNTIELTHPMTLSLITNNDLREIVRNYSIYPGYGFIRIAVVGKSEATYIPLTNLILSYGMEALFSETTTAGRIAVEYGSSDKWVPSLDKNKVVFNKIEIPSLLEILKQQLGLRKKAFVGSESLKRQLSKFSLYFREFLLDDSLHNNDTEEEFYIALPELPFDILKIKLLENEEVDVIQDSLVHLSSTINLALKNKEPNKSLDTITKEIREQLENLYTVSYFREYNELTEPFRQLIDANIIGQFTIQELKGQLISFPELKYTLSLLQKVQNLTPNTINLNISELGILFSSIFSMEDAIKRMKENILIVNQELNTWQLSSEMKLHFYRDINQKLKELLKEKVGDNNLYDILVPL
ncbi:MAG: hypothetical protein K9W46_00375 [Candidatus Heimdallarchaeum endolithica]|uniref:Uncharacterized protein n=1 Tax=Candidatus Heimdallarchaeum endolithica TaxID=2876572 RepID=A0A9Y1BR31_9ARCH|nr:MAG: hypothetical protein K9W46_00375 [Candidatus Heimdallarchaeum endolithica]